MKVVHHFQVSDEIVVNGVFRSATLRTRRSKVGREMMNSVAARGPDFHALFEGAVECIGTHYAAIGVASTPHAPQASQDSDEA